MKIKRSKISELNRTRPVGQNVTVAGWVRSRRSGKKVHFIALNDGSTIHSLQGVVDAGLFEESVIQSVTTGACVRLSGTVVQSPGKGQPIELQVTQIEVYGPADPDSYPLQKKGHSLEFLRRIAHLRPRTNTFGAMLRIRNTLAYAIHSFFHSRGFCCLHTPIITASDCEGAGNMFRVTTIDPGDPPRTAQGGIDYEEDFFGQETRLTVSGQLEGEAGALALSEIYTFGPTFRAENSHTPRHLAEFWMVEPEMAFYDLDDTIDLAEEFIIQIIKDVLEQRHDDLVFFNTRYDKGLIERLLSVTQGTFERISYSDAIDILAKADASFEFPVGWGCDLQAEHERYLVERYFKKPVVVTDYPKEIKPFYMKLNSDGSTVRAMDVLFPYIGEIIGGSQREDSLRALSERLNETGVAEKDIWWYRELRMFGSAPHSGFGLGFERLMLFVTGLSNIRDVIAFPRTPKNAAF